MLLLEKNLESRMEWRTLSSALLIHHEISLER